MDPSFSDPGNPVGGALYFLSELSFKWVPGVITSIYGESAFNGPNPVTTIITTPVSAPQVFEYLQMASTPGAYDTLFQRWGEFVALSFLVSICAAAIVTYCCVRVFQIRQVERHRFAAAQRSVAAHDTPKTQLRWSRILQQSEGEDQKAARLAILEADIMLNELLDVLGYKGETMADKMRQVDRANFNTIDLAWEAHKIRNRIAHDGDAHEMSSREIRRVIDLYERVLKEFHFV